MSEKEVKNNTDQVLEELSELSEKDLDGVAGGEEAPQRPVECGSPSYFKILCPANAVSTPGCGRPSAVKG